MAPWHIEDDNPDCDGWAVVKDDDDSIAGCHDSEAEAEAQMAALYAGEDDANSTRGLGRQPGRGGEFVPPRFGTRDPRATMPAVDLSLRAERAKRLVREQRFVHASTEHPLSIRAKADDPEAKDSDLLLFNGYAAIFGAVYEVWDWLGMYEESVEAGAFTKTLREQDDVRFLIEHEGLAIARTKYHTLRLHEDDIGLATEADLLATDPDVQRLAAKLPRGDVDQMSFMFEATRQEWNEDFTRRRIMEAKLWDVSVVTFPASDSTTAGLRGMDLVLALADADPDQLLVAARSANGDLTRSAVERAQATLARLLEPEGRAHSEGITPPAPAPRDPPSTITPDEVRRNLELLTLKG